MFIKEYKVDIKRKIAEAIPTKVYDKDVEFAIESDNLLKINLINKTYRSLLYNIKETQKGITIYSNTLNLKITDKYLNKEPMYQYIETTEIIDSLFNKDLIPFLRKDLASSYIYYFNTESSVLFEYLVKDVIIVNNVYLKSGNVTIRKLKDRFKIDVKGSEKFSVRLGSEYLFEPQLCNNYIVFYDCIFKYNSVVYSLKTLSFEVVEKEEYFPKETFSLKLAKAPINSVILKEEREEYIVLKYTTYISNLMFDKRSISSFYVNLDLNSEQLLKIVKTQSDGSLCSVSSKGKLKTFIVNPNLPSIKVTKTGENCSIILGEISTKYSEQDNILLGNSSLILNLEKLVTKQEEYFKINGRVLTQKRESRDYDIDVKTDNDKLGEVLKNRLIAFINKIESVKGNLQKQEDPTITIGVKGNG